MDPLLTDTHEHCAIISDCLHGVILPQWTVNLAASPGTLHMTLIMHWSGLNLQMPTFGWTGSRTARPLGPTAAQRTVT